MVELGAKRVTMDSQDLLNNVCETIEDMSRENHRKGILQGIHTFLVMPSLYLNDLTRDLEAMPEVEEDPDA